MEKGGIEPCLASITARQEGPVNWRGAARDFWGALAESRPIAAAPDDPLSGP